jgi:hypothetical protein
MMNVLIYWIVFYWICGITVAAPAVAIWDIGPGEILTLGLIVLFWPLIVLIIVAAAPVSGLMLLIECLRAG